MTEPTVTDEHMIAPGDVPTLLVRRTSDGAVEVCGDASEWSSEGELMDFASWLEPVVEIFAERDSIARRIGELPLTAERMATDLADTARALLSPTHLSQSREGLWRFRGGRAPSPPPARDWGTH